MTVQEDEDQVLIATRKLRGETYKLKANLCFLVDEITRNVKSSDFQRWPDRSRRATEVSEALDEIRARLESINRSLDPLIDRHSAREIAALQSAPTAQMFDLATVRAARQNGRK